MNPLRDPIRTVLAIPRSRTRARLQAWLRQEFDFRVVGLASNGVAAVRLLRQTLPDVVFLQVELPGQDAFEVLEALGGDVPPVVILLSPSGSAAARAFQWRVADYLHGTFGLARLRDSLDRARGWVWSRVFRNADTGSVDLAAVRPIAFRHNGRVCLVKHDDVLWVQAARRRTRIHFVDGPREASIPFGRFMKRLSGRLFLQVNRSTAVHRDYIQEIRPKSHGDHWVLLESGQRVVLSRTRRVGVLRRL